jgi:hypothetical protein
MVDKLRWLTGGASALFCVLWVAFFVFANTFRRSFGASPNEAWKLILPLAVAGLVLLTSLWPTQRWLLHLTLVAIIVTAIGALSILPKAPIIATLGLAYCAAWCAFYYLTLTPSRPTP